MYAAYILTIRVIFLVVHVMVAALIFARRSDEPVALLFSLTLIASAVALNTTLESLWQRYPGSALSITAGLVQLFGEAALFIFCYLFPDGRFTPRWTCLAALGFVAVEGAQFYLRGSPVDPNTWPIGMRLALYIALFGSCVVAPIYRYRYVSDRVQRQQIKWVVFGYTTAMGGFIALAVAAVAYILLAPQRPPGTLDAFLELAGVTLYLLLFLAVPATVAIAILRFRLFNIDVIINRALVYGLLTGALVLVYAGGVVLLQAIFRGLTGQVFDSQLAVVAATLSSAALFTPLRRRIQMMIDRRFYRSKYDATYTLSSFSAKLRDEVDLNRLAVDLLAVVDETMRPAHVSLWLRERNHEDTKIQRS
jgi:hypothetical protein